MIPKDQFVLGKENAHLAEEGLFTLEGAGEGWKTMLEETCSLSARLGHSRRMVSYVGPCIPVTTK